MTGLLGDVGPVGWGLIAAAVAVVVSLWTPWRRWVPVLGLAAVFAGLGAGRFDGEPHLPDKLDLTTMFWARALIRRAIAGGACLLVAVPMGLAAAPDASPRRAAAGGLAVFGPLGLASLASAIGSIVAMGSAAPSTDAARRVETQRAAIEHSQQMLVAGVALSLLGAAVVSYSLLRATRAQACGRS